MRKILILKIIRNLEQKPHLKRKVKIFAVVGLIGFLLTGAATIWAGVTVIRYFADSANVIMSSPQTLDQVENFKSEAKKYSLQPLNCWGKAQSLLAVEPWLARPVLENLKNLKVACFETTTPVCEGQECF